METLDSVCLCLCATLLHTRLTPHDIYSCLFAAEKAATNSRLASTLLDCITKGCHTHSRQQLSVSNHSRPDSGSGLSSVGAAQQPVIIVACVESAEDVAPGLRRCFTHELQLEAPDAPARKHLLQVCLLPCCAMLCHAVPYCAMLCHAVTCCDVLCHAVPCCDVLSAHGGIRLTVQPGCLTHTGGLCQ